MAHTINLKIMQWNCQGISNKKGEILIISDCFDILLLSETFMKSTKQFYLKNFNIIQSDRLSNRGGGLAIAIRDNIKFSRINSITNIENSLETLAISINTSIGELLIVSVYRVPSSENKISDATWSSFFNSILTTNIPSIMIAGNFNCHHSSWGSSRNCFNGIGLQNFVDNSDFICANNGKPTFRNRPGNLDSILDLTILSPNLFISSSWDVWSDNLGSDHFPVITNLGISTPTSNFFTHKYNLNKFSWSNFSTELSKFIEDNKISATSPHNHILDN